MASKAFYRSDRLRSFLRFVVERWLHDPGTAAKEYHIGTEVYGRPTSFDPRYDPIVRVEARRLRAKLDEYYRYEGRNDAVEISIPRGTYRPSFRARIRSEGTPEDPSDADEKSIAIEPFAVLDANGNDDEFSRGLTEELVHALNTGGVQVRAWQPNTPFSKLRSYDKAKQKLVYAVLQGSIRRTGPDVRLLARLITTSNASVTWSRSYSRIIEDEFAAQKDLARSIASAVRQEVIHGHLGNCPSNSKPEPGALLGNQNGPIHLEGITSEELTKAQEFLNDSAALHAESISLQIAIADASVLLATFGQCPGTAVLPGVQRAASVMLGMDPNLADAHAMLGMVAAASDHDFIEAERRFLLALECNPLSRKARSWYSTFCLLPQRRFREALQIISLADDSDPGALLHRLWLVLGCTDHEEAAAHLQKSLNQRPALPLAHWLLGLKYEQVRDLDAAIAAFQKAREVSGSLPCIIASLGHAYALLGQEAQALHCLADLHTLAATRYISPFDLACIHAGLGNSDLALSYLVRAFEDQYPGLVWLAVDSRFRGLSENPQFFALLERLGLEAACTAAASQ